MKKIPTFLVIIVAALALQGCVHKVVTTPVKVAYKTTKGVVKGTVAVAKMAIPDNDKKDDKEQN